MATATKTHPSRTNRPRAYTEAERLAELEAYVRLAMTILVEKTNDDPKEMANLTGLSISTIYRYRAGAAPGLAMRCGTLQALAVGSGLHLTLTESEITLRVVG